uniref:Chromosome 3 open reading frame 70 n=1 Tax=Cyprinus carpio TaxID=7962 RepID=A0A8C2I9N3_CYPCA
MAASGGQKSEKLDEAQALARSCAGRPDFLPCDGLSICATHSHGKCFKLHWCCHLGWCHCKYVYQPMTSVCQLPSTPVPVAPSGHTHTMNLSISLAERFLRTAPKFQAPPCPESPKLCVISELFVDDYMVKRINGKMCYVQRPPPPTPNPTHQPQIPKISGPKMDHCSSPSSSEDSGINALGLHYMESCDEDSCVDDDDEEEEDDELSTDGDSSPGSLWDQDECTLLSPSKSMVEIIEKIETTV